MWKILKHYFFTLVRWGPFRYWLPLVVFAFLFLLPSEGLCRIYIDINAPSFQKFKIAIPEFHHLGDGNPRSGLARKLTQVITHDLDLSGYFSPLDQEAFLGEEGNALTLEEIQFKNWSAIGADLLLKGGYTCIGGHIELEVRLFDVILGREILGKRMLGDLKDYRHLMHRVGNEIIRVLTGKAGIFLSRLAFIGNASGHKEVYVSDYDGHNLRQITNDASIALFPTLSPDGEKLLYTSYKEGRGPVLYLKFLKTGMERVLSARKELNIGACWAPDGERVALTLSRQGNSEIFTIDLQGNILERLTRHWAIDVSPTFSPDGTKMAFVSNRSGSPQIYIRDLVEKEVRRLTFDHEVGNYNVSPAWSPQGQQIVFSSMTDGRFDLYTIKSDGSELKRLTQDQGDNEDPCWSPDGRYIVFSSNRQGSYHLYLMNAIGGNQRKITSFRGDQTSPSMAPPGGQRGLLEP